MRWMVFVMSPIVLVLSYYYFRIRLMMGLDTQFTPLNDEKCTRIDLPGFSEDLVEYHGKAIACLVLRDTPKKETISADSEEQRELAAIDIDTLTYDPIPIRNYPPGLPFNPHGTYLLEDKLYVINHCFSNIGDQVEVIKLSFEEGEISAEFLESIHFGMEYNGMLNDIALANENQLYVSLYKFKPDMPEEKEYDTLMKRLERYFKYLIWPHCKLLACKIKDDGLHCTEEDTGYMFNGVTSRNKNLVIAADMIAKKLYIYKIKKIGRLRKILTVDLSYPVDNIHYSPEFDELYGAGSIRIDDANNHVMSVETGNIPPPVPGFVFKVDLKAKKLEEEVLFKGDMINFPSSAIRIGDKIVIGSPDTYAVAVCDLEGN